MEAQDLKRRFNSHPTTDEQIGKMMIVRKMALELAERIDSYTPDGREKSLAITSLEETVFWANAAISRDQS